MAMIDNDIFDNYIRPLRSVTCISVSVFMQLPTRQIVAREKKFQGPVHRHNLSMVQPMQYVDFRIFTTAMLGDRVGLRVTCVDGLHACVRARARVCKPV